MLTRSVFQSDGPSLLPSSLMQDEVPESNATLDIAKAAEPSSIRPLWEIEKEALQYTLTELKGNISQAAAQLQISRTAIYRKIKKYDLNFSDNQGQEESKDA
ncbi:MAG: hypothetical protein HN932_01570 [Candidatus Marinimicrobia bacterium]|nr:hypothetical protein [Candidatus Neomarinimicrobiota bacterium]MBT7089145.1 hypothetical protein [Candidatus Neomarinimicrobiota bacterium]